MEAGAESRGGRQVALLLSLLVVVVSGWAALAGATWGFGLKCDDSCGTPPPWREDPDAWQWNALGLSGIGAFACALLLFVALIARRRAVAWIAVGGWLALGVTFLELLDGSGLA